MVKVSVWVRVRNWTIGIADMNHERWGQPGGNPNFWGHAPSPLVRRNAIGSSRPGVLCVVRHTSSPVPAARVRCIHHPSDRSPPTHPPSASSSSLLSPARCLSPCPSFCLCLCLPSVNKRYDNTHYVNGGGASLVYHEES